MSTRFDCLQGTETVEGLWTRETLLVDKTLLQLLSEKLPLGIVTGSNRSSVIHIKRDLGRPRSDANRFLETFELTGLFKSVVCMEDAPVKPNPKPVLLGLEQLGVQRALFIGKACLFEIDNSQTKLT